MSFFKRSGMLLGLLAAAVFVVACGETIIDSTKTEDALKANLSKSLGTKVVAVDCPSDIEVEPKATFTCSVELTGGKTETATLKILNEDADVSVVKLSGTSQQGQ